MIAKILPQAEIDIEEAFKYYKTANVELARRFLHEYRRGIERICRFPNAWAPIDDVYRRFRLRRFPYGLVLSHRCSAERGIHRCRDAFES